MSVESSSVIANPKTHTLYSNLVKWKFRNVSENYETRCVFIGMFQNTSTAGL